ncbi:unnamed protein product [Blepharisma stoltei]|uniref:Glutaredoxin domain-containing protein n=1 Tax=Blepharisma stoltei TaxID=1481888 RepID=A0AAU9JQH9_9CILI|nr:unnamed protein product [Blepharisma stoltei]
MGAYCCAAPESTVSDFSIAKEISNNSVVIFSKTGCSTSLGAKMKLYSEGVNFKVIEVNKRTSKLKEELKNYTNKEDFPYVFLEGHYIGGIHELEEKINLGTLKKFKSDN